MQNIGQKLSRLLNFVLTSVMLQQRHRDPGRRMLLILVLQELLVNTVFLIKIDLSRGFDVKCHVLGVFTR
jgi:hypothetical protein